MLFEKTVYENDFPISMRIMKVTEYPIHYHQDIEFVYVLKGEVRLKDVCSNYLLKEGDLFTINGHEVHGLTATDKDNVVAVIQVSNRFFTQYFPSLGKACFMTGGKNDPHNKLDQLRKILLRVLLDYSRKSFNYKNDCTYQMIDAIHYLNEHFNLFAFDGQDVLNFKSSNPVIVERISRIINYVYENHANKISLDELADREHLSTFYLSHLIREHMGISFQEFLSFARVEMSEIPLLETEAKISSIAADCGFSTTFYYEKFFLKWFGRTPQQHRQQFMEHILSNDHPARIEILPENHAVRLLKQCLSAESDQESSSSVINHLHLNVAITEDAPSLMPFRHSLEVAITQEDYLVMGEQLFSFLHELNVSRVVLLSGSGDSESSLMLLANRLNFLGYSVSNASKSTMDIPISYGHDSICAAIHLLQTLPSFGSQTLHLRLRDQGESLKILKGFPACLTSCMIPKPVFYAYQLVNSMKGDLISWGKYYYVIRTKTDTLQDSPAYILVLFNFSDEINQLCTRPASIHETNDVIRAFMDELSIDFSIPVSPGKYVIAKYALSNDHSIFAQMAHINFPDMFPLQDEWIHLLNTEPLSQITMETAENMLSVNASVRGAGIHVIVAKRVES